MRGRSVLTEGLPKAVVVDGVTVPIETDYRLGLLVQSAVRDRTLGDGIRAELLIRLYCGQVPAGVDPEKLLGRLLDFFAMDPYRERERWANIPADGPPILDFEADGDRILASFLSAYGVDLLAVRMHWWQFMALLMHLPEETPFMRTAALRAADPGQIQDDTLRRRLRQAKAAVRLPVPLPVPAADREKGTESIHFR